MIEVERGGFEALLQGSKACEDLVIDIAAWAEENCPDKIDEITAILILFHNANCGPLHRWAKKKLSED